MATLRGLAVKRAEGLGYSITRKSSPPHMACLH